jgi:site-specific DNA-methyltransferase (adenine-specific)
MNGAFSLLDQYPTPAWVAQALVNDHFSDLTAQDVVCDPTCGPGRFLQAVPEHVGAFGVEIDPRLAQQAHALTGRPVVTGDIRTADLPLQPTAFLGNPPFQMKLVDLILERAHTVLPNEGRVGLILPCYAMQTASRVVRYNEQWSISQEMIPRNIYPGLSKPLLFALFRKDARRIMVGFSLYHEAAHVLSLTKELQDALTQGPATWGQIVTEAIEAMGGEAKLRDIYEYVSTRRPSATPHWKEQVRKVCAQRTVRRAPAVYALANHQG